MPLPEKALISRIASKAKSPALTTRPRGTTDFQKGGTRSRVAGLQRGIGDDCAVLRLPRGHEALVTTDFSLEGVHFRRERHSAESVGHRCLARGLSDIAAMGGEPVAAFLSLAVPERLPQRWVDQFLRGFLALAKKFSVPLAGGDTAQSPAGVLADIVILGSVPAGTAVLRSGARPGDKLYVTGQLGASALVLSRFMAGRTKISERRNAAHFFPMPRIPAGRALREEGIASAMIDISDGLSTDLGHLCQESRVGARIYAEQLPVTGGRANLRFALHGGEDYELLFSAHGIVPKSIAGVPIACIGEITRRRKIVLIQGGKERALPAGGWEHFSSRKR